MQLWASLQSREADGGAQRHTQPDISRLITKNALTQRKTPWCVSHEHH